MNKGYIAIIISVILVLGLILSTIVLGNSIKSIKEDTTISVTGSAQDKITSDYAVWSGSFSAQSPVQKDSYAKVVADQKIVADFLKSLGAKDEEISFLPIYTNTIFKKSQMNDYATTNEVEAYSLSQSVTVKTSDVNLAQKISTKATDLIAQNVNFASNSPQFYCKDLSKAKITMIGKATKDCKDRAEQIVSNAGGKLGNILSAKSGVFQITPENSTEISDEGMNDTSSINKQITAVVKCTFSVK